MDKETLTLLKGDEARLQAKGLYGRLGDSLSLRVPGQEQFLLQCAGETEISTAAFDTQARPAGIHAAIYKVRADAGAILVGQTDWSEALESLGSAVPTLFDEQARHLGEVASPVRAGDLNGLLKALEKEANIAIYGKQRVCIGSTPDRLIFYTELFEKCAKAYVIARCSGKRIREIPFWVRYIAGGRLRKDQKRSASSYAAGRRPERMNAY